MEEMFFLLMTNRKFTYPNGLYEAFEITLLVKTYADVDKVFIV